MSFEPVILAMAVLSLGIGLGLYLWLTARPLRHAYFNTTNIISWLLIALFPVLIIFSFFPASTFDASIKGASMGGAIGAFIFIWWYGTRSGIAASVVDAQNAEIARLTAELGAKEAAGGKRRAQKLQPASSRSYRIRKSGKTITLFTGSIDQLAKAEIWVSSENTNMQMARFYDRSVSGTIRYLGALKDVRNQVLEDTIADELEALMEAHRTVEPCTVLATGAGALGKSHGVRRILHVAAVQGEVSSGYKPIGNIEGCVSAALKAADGLGLDPAARSIALPLFGTGTARGALEEIVKPMLLGAIHYLAEAPTSLEHVFFLTWSEDEFEACKAVLDAQPALQPRA